MATINKHNNGHIDGTLVEKPKLIKTYTLRNGEASVMCQFLVKTLEDPDITASYGGNGEVLPISIFMPKDAYEDAEFSAIDAGATFSGDIRLLSSVSQDGSYRYVYVRVDEVTIGGTVFPRANPQPKPVAKQKPSSNYSNDSNDDYLYEKGDATYDFLSDDELDDWASDGDRGAWDEGWQRGLWK